MYGGVEGPDEKKNSDEIGFIGIFFVLSYFFEQINKLFVPTN